VAEKELRQYPSINAIGSGTRFVALEDGRNVQVSASVLGNFVDGQIDASVLPGEIEALKAGQQTSAIYVQTLGDLQALIGTYEGQGAFVTGGDGAGQYRWDGVAWEFLRPDLLTEKADKEVVEPLVPVVERLDDVYKFGAMQGYAFNITCPHPTLPGARVVAGGVLNDGTNKWHSGEYVDLKVTGELDAQLRSLPSLALAGYASNTFDSRFAAAGGTTDDGVLRYNEAHFEVLNGFPVESLIFGHRAVFDGQLMHIAGGGQSLQAGVVDAKTTAQEYDSVGFPAQSVDPSAYAPLTAANCSQGGNREVPTFGMCGMVKQLIRDEDGLTPEDQDYQLLVGNAGHGGYNIAQLSKGTVPYSQLIGQVRAGFDIAQVQGRRFVASALAWVQGPGDYLNGYRYYLDRQLALASDFDADCRAITGQDRPVITVISQSASQGAAHQRPVPLAQLEASLRSASIVLSAPEYQFTYLPDGMQVHVDGASTRLLGAYLGLALKRTLIDGKKWRPLMPTNIDIQGRVIYVRFNRSGLQLDDELVPPQPQYGFSLLDPTGTSIALSDIRIVQPDTICMVAASAPIAGSQLWLGGDTAVGIANYAGGASNVRDSQGDDLTFDAYPLHNWAVVFAARL